MTFKRSLSLLGTALITASLLIPILPPRSSSAQGILPPYRFGGTPIRPLPLRLDRGFKSARSARYYFQVPDPQIPVTRFTIIETTDNFAQKGGRFDLSKLDLMSCSDLGNVLRRPTCEEESLPIQQVTWCSSAIGCQIYTPATGELTQNGDEPYEGTPYIEVIPVEPLSGGTNFMMVFSDVRNPRSPVEYQFNLAAETLPGRVNRCQVVTNLGHCALGTWLVTIRNDPND